MREWRREKAKLEVKSPIRHSNRKKKRWTPPPSVYTEEGLSPPEPEGRDSQMRREDTETMSTTLVGVNVGRKGFLDPMEETATLLEDGGEKSECGETGERLARTSSMLEVRRTCYAKPEPGKRDDVDWHGMAVRGESEEEEERKNVILCIGFKFVWPVAYRGTDLNIMPASCLGEKKKGTETGMSSTTLVSPSPRQDGDDSTSSAKQTQGTIGQQCGPMPMHESITTPRQAAINTQTCGRDNGLLHRAATWRILMRVEGGGMGWGSGREGGGGLCGGAWVERSEPRSTGGEQDGSGIGDPPVGGTSKEPCQSDDAPGPDGSSIFRPVKIPLQGGSLMFSGPASPPSTTRSHRRGEELVNDPAMSISACGRGKYLCRGSSRRERLPADTQYPHAVPPALRVHR
ncbi:hypothetical protein DFH07DRAFT_938285 [Mycena maculata]|uniref:Uncharacterized protein n=1 Tax=Mycena maculata TaxID=230809 RepID=A0AAD7NNJ5_9AGAR|nr:hypothetical protein DFH07DRAFT_938285 [Mycena maculata]